MNRTDYWNSKPELKWERTGIYWDRRHCIRHVASMLNRPRVLEIGVDRAEIVSFCHDVFGSYTGVDISLKKEPLSLKDISCKFNFVEATSVEFWKSLGNNDLFDLFYIDGNHSENYSHLDITQAMLRLAPGGYILAHDITKYDSTKDTGPAWSYNRLCNIPRWYSRILEDHGEGMGIFFKEER